MGSNLVIAAIPDENDRVWKISSEKIPHLTLLFLGEVDQVSNLDQIMLFVEHAASTTLKRFYLPVDRRGKLGEDEADVLFFKKSRYDYKAIHDFRASLLKDQNIKTAYDSAKQFDGPWQPHLTLGYPTAPAKPLDDNEGFSFFDVQFNKIAVWTGDFEGPDFLLKDYGDDWNEMDAPIPMDVAMSDILEHHGVKGQKWGVRKVEEGGPNAHIRINNKTGQAGLSTQATVAILAPALIMPPLVPVAFLSKRVRAEVKAAREVNKGVRAEKKQAKADQKFEKHAHSAQNFAAIHNGAQNQINQGIHDINQKYPNDLTKDPSAQKKYDDDVVKMMQDSYRTSANQLGNKTGTRHLDVEFKNDGLDFKIVAKEGMQTPTVERIKHAADDSDAEFAGKIKRAATGHILGFEFDDFKPKSMAHTADLGEEFLSHYGIKGMQWGVRREGAVTTRAHIDSGILRRQTKIEAKGGEAHPPSNDAIKAEVNKRKLKKSGTASLSNQELRELQTRLQLEAQVTMLTTKKGQKLVRQQLEEEGKQQLRRGVGRGIGTGVKAASPHVVRKARRGAATLAVSALL